MGASLSKHINKLNKLSHKEQCAYITKKLIPVEPDDIFHLTFLKNLQKYLLIYLIT